MTSTRLRSTPAWLVLFLAAACSGDDAAVSEGSSSTGEDESSSSPSTTIDPTAPTMSATMADSSSTEADSSSTGADTTDTSDGSSSTTEAPSTAPVAEDDVFYTRQDQQLVVRAAGLLDNDVDADGDDLVIASFDAASTGGGTVVVDDDGALDYTPAAGFFGTDTFEYAVTDGTDEASATVTVYVAPVLVPLGAVAGGLGGFAIDGEVDDDEAAAPVAAGGDVDGDGLDDILVGAPGSDQVQPNAGRGYVVLGKTDDTDTVLLADLVEGTGGFVIDPEFISSETARGISNAGDVNGDGLADILVGAPQESIAYLVFGRAGDTMPIDLAEVASGVGGFVLVGEGNTDFSGRRVKPAGDVNGDAVPDLLIGAPLRDVNGSDGGRVYVVFGDPDATEAVDLGDVADGTGGFVIDGETAFDYAGFALGGGADINGDGLADVVVGAYGANVGIASAGRAYVVFGKDNDTDAVALADVAAGTGGFVIDGELASDACGFSVASPGDVDGDGLGDVLVGAPNNDINGSNSGRSYLVFGRAETDPVPLVDVAAGTGGFAIDGEDFGENSGGAVGPAGDVNGDGLADLVISSQSADYAAPNAGRTYVVYGRASTDPVVLTDVATGIGGFALDGEFEDDISGSAVDGGFDVNGDGFADVVIGASGADLDGVDIGRGYVVFGVPTEPE